MCKLNIEKVRKIANFQAATSALECKNSAKKVEVTNTSLGSAVVDGKAGKLAKNRKIILKVLKANISVIMKNLAKMVWNSR